MRLFLDANVLFSAAKSDGAVRELLVRLRAQGHRLVADDYVVAEARRNLALKSSHALAELEKLLADFEVAPYQSGALPGTLHDLLPAKDRPVLVAAIRLQCHALVTGDRTHFGALYGKSAGGVAIHSPQSIAESLMKK